MRIVGRRTSERCPICLEAGFVSFMYWDYDRYELVCPDEREHEQ